MLYSIPPRTALLVPAPLPTIIAESYRRTEWLLRSLIGCAIDGAHMICNIVLNMVISNHFSLLLNGRDLRFKSVVLAGVLSEDENHQHDRTC